MSEFLITHKYNINMSSNLIPYINKIGILNNCYLFYKILKIILILNLIFILIKINITF